MVSVLVWPYRGCSPDCRPPLVENALIAVIGGAALVSLLAVVPLCLLSLVRRYRQTDAVRRAQLRLVVVAAAVTAAVFAGANAAAAPPAVEHVAVPLLPAALLVAVLRYRLFDIDLVVRRSLVYLVLTAGVVAIYMIAVGAASAAFDNPDSVPRSSPPRWWRCSSSPPTSGCGAWSGRTVYGDRDPYEAISRLAPQLQAAGGRAMSCPRCSTRSPDALRAPTVTIASAPTGRSGARRPVGPPTDDALSVPLTNEAFRSERSRSRLVAGRRQSVPPTAD